MFKISKINMQKFRIIYIQIKQNMKCVHKKYVKSGFQLAQLVKFFIVV